MIKNKEDYKNSTEVWEDIQVLVNGNETYDEIFAEIQGVIDSQLPDDLRRILLLTKRLKKRKTGTDDVIELLFIWMNLFLSEQSDSFLEQLNWWDKIYIEKYTTELREVFDAIDKADYEETEEALARAKEVVSNLDRDKYKYNILLFDKRLTILEKRLERKVSSNFSSLIKSLRKKRGLSLAETGKLAGVSASYINRMELGDRKAPSIPVMEQLADALGVDVSVLLVAAGVASNPSERKSIRELFFSNEVYVTNKEKLLDTEKKEKLIALLDYIEKMEWKENKHMETIEVINLINNIKEK